ncbi:O-antigen ligase [Halomonas ventosae]|uniref:O-antigen ligase n=1 Tax=Halomonas ventosae TaxID=229007 RepID=A0A4R6ZWV0_9GAMM|nr:O-antigen ligase family protein [Halomonas ventosae]TDR57295.1 O-antigen ligase [Halomonas ventosae]
MSRFFVFSNGWLLFSFLAWLIVIPWGYAVIPLMVLGMILLRLPVMRHVASRLDLRDLSFCLAFFLYTAIWLMDVWQSGDWLVADGVAMPLWPVLATMVLIWLRLFPPSPRLWWAGLCTGSLLAGSIALFEYRVLMLERVGNGMNAIPFGNIALLLGCLSLVASFWWLKNERGARGKVWFSLAAAAGGMLASLLSGTRGGWLAAPVLAILIWIAWQSMPDHEVHYWRRRSWLTVTLVIMMLVGVFFLGEPASRLAAAINQFQGYWLSGDCGGSIGLRLEMWKGGVILFSERPLTGWGEGGLEAARDALVDQGLVYPGISVFTQLHSDMIDTAARRGLVGLVSLLGLYGVPLTLFWRCRRDPDPRVRLLAIAGVMIVTSFMIFGFSQSMLRDVRGLSGYLGLCVGCWAVLRSIESSNRSACPPGERCVNARAPVR